MSVPEYVRRKSGTMFSCHPPFGYSTTSQTLPTPFSDLRSRTPPLSLYREYPIHSFAAELARRASVQTQHMQDFSAAVVEKHHTEEYEKEPFRQEEVAAALFSSSKRTDVKLETKSPGKDEVVMQPEVEVQEDEEEENEQTSSSCSTLPDLLRHISGPPSPTVSHHEAITPVVERYDPLQRPIGQLRKEKLHCPKCGVRLTVVVEEDEGEEREEDDAKVEVVCGCGARAVCASGIEGLSAERTSNEDEAHDDLVSTGKWAPAKEGRVEGPVQVCRGAW